MACGGGEGCLPACATIDRRACLEGRAASREDMPPTLSSILTRAARGFFQLDATPPHISPSSLCRVACPSSCLPPSCLYGHMCAMPASQPARRGGVVWCGVVWCVGCVLVCGWVVVSPASLPSCPSSSAGMCLSVQLPNDSIQWARAVWCSVDGASQVRGGSVLVSRKKMHPYVWRFISVSIDAKSPLSC